MGMQNCDIGGQHHKGMSCSSGTPLRVSSAAANSICRYRDLPQRLTSQRDVLRIRHPLRVHLLQQTASLLVLHHELHAYT